VESAKLLIAAGSKVNDHDATAWVPAREGEREALALDTAKLAVELGVDVNVANSDGPTALAAARNLGDDAVVRFLKDNGAR